MKKKSKTEEIVSASKQKRLDRQAEKARKKRQELINKIIWIAAAVLAAALVVLLIVSAIVKKANTVTMSTDYSAELDENGTIKGVKAADYVTLPDYENITADLAEIEYSDESVESDIAEILEEYTELSEDENLEAALDDTVNIDYVGTIDGEEFEGGSSEGYDLTLGSGTFIDDFEDQIEGHKAGDVFDVEVTFPDDYETETLAGADAVFNVTLNGIYVTPEFTDEFVAENLSDYADTAEGYRQYLKDTNYEENLIDFVENYLIENTTVNKTPKAYKKSLMANYKANDYSYYEYMNSLYSSSLGYSAYADFSDYLSTTYDQTEEEYDEALKESVMDDMTYVLACQAIAEKENITATEEEALAEYMENGGTEEEFEAQTETYGLAYFVQQVLCEKVLNFVAEKVTVE